MKGAAWGTVAVLLLVNLQSAWGDSALLPLRSFGIANTAAANPNAELIEGTNGVLYGTAAGDQLGDGAVFQIQKDGTGFTVLKRFGANPNEGRRPFAAVVEGSDGMLYGSTVTGGTNGLGTIFRLAKDGTAFSVIKHFTGPDGAYPEARLLEANAGLWYGTTSGGGTNDSGLVFRMGLDGSDFTVLQAFNGTNGANPEAGLLKGSDGLLYGTTYSGGSSNLGTAFKITTNGTGFTVLKSFYSAFSTNGYAPLSRLVEGTNGLLYGTTSAGGTNTTGTIFSLSKDGAQFKTLRSFGGTNGLTPLAGLTLASDQLLYGITSTGGSNGFGTVFRLDHAGSSFAIITNMVVAQGSAASLLETTNGTLYGTSTAGGLGYGTVFSLNKNGSKFTVLQRLHTSGHDGIGPSAGLTLGSDGWLYGTTRSGGTPSSGSIYSILPGPRDYHVLWNFDDGGDYSPFAGLIEGTNGILYGANEFSFGKLFSIGKNGTSYNPIYSFTGPNGLNPRGTLLQGNDGLLYGTTLLTSSPGPGMIFKVSTGGTGYTVLKQFTVGSGDGQDPMQALIQGRDNLLYGTTPYGNISSPTQNNGVVFKLSTTGSGYTVLKTFTNTLQGAIPLSPLLQASDSMLYGTTYSGGNSNNAGVVFRMATNGTGFQVLRTFLGTAGDGRHPCGRLVENSDGAIYGTTERGGVNDYGTVFKLNKDGGNYAVLASFTAASGRHPRGGVVIGPDGALYGTTEQLGALNFGTVFRYGPIEMISGFQVVGNQPTFSFTGIPGTNYWIERATNLIPPVAWTTRLVTNAPPDGAFQFSDDVALADGAFYRLRR